MERIEISEVKKYFGDVVKLVANGRQRILVREKSKDRAAFIPLEDLALLENLDRGKNVPVEHVPAADVKKHLHDDLAEVVNRQERMILQENGKDVLAIVPFRDVALLEGLDEQLDMEAAKRLLEKQMDKRGWTPGLGGGPAQA